MEGTDSGENQGILLLTELSLIKQLGIQLESGLNEQVPNSSIEQSKSIVAQLLCRADKSMCLAKEFALGLTPREPASPPRSTSASPASGMSETAFRCLDDNDDNHNNNNNNKKEGSKKRKTLPKWRSQVRVGSTGGVEGPLDDGHSWRKYGQKDILGAKHPRGYYRCTYRNSQGCMATKQVQRTDENPTVFDVIYQGNHTCINKCNARHGSNIHSINNNNNNNNKNNSNNIDNCNIVDKQTAHSSHEQEYLNSLKATLTVKTEGLGLLGSGQQEAQEYNSISFSFPSTPIESGHLAAVSSNYFPTGGLLPSFTSSPATSGSNYFSVSPCAVSGYEYDNGVGGLGFRKVDSDLTEVVSALSAATSTSNSPMGDTDLVFSGLDFDNSFPSSFFS